MPVVVFNNCLFVSVKQFLAEAKEQFTAKWEKPAVVSKYLFRIVLYDPKTEKQVIM